MLWRWYGSGVFLLHQFVDGALDLLRAAGNGIPVCRCKDSKSIHTNGGKKWDSEKKYPSAGASHINADSFSYALVCLSGTLRSKSQNNMHYF